MAGAMRKMAVYLGLVEDETFDDDLYYGDSTAPETRQRERSERDGVQADSRDSRVTDARDSRVATRERRPSTWASASASRRTQDADSGVNSAESGRGQEGNRGAEAGRAGTEPGSARPARNWRVDTTSDTTVHEPISSHPAGTRARARITPRQAAHTGDLKITTLHPRSYNDARRIGEEYRSGTPVIMNLTELEDTDAKRIVDFAAGLVFGLRGSIERVTNKVFLLSPANVDVTEAARARLAKDGVVQR